MRRLSTITALVCLAALAAPGSSFAGARQRTVMQDEGLLLRSGPVARAAVLDEFRALGADVVKVQVHWNEIAPGPRKPAGFDGSNPASYRWTDYDSIVRGTLARGMRPYLSLGGRAPSWAVRKRTRRHNGTYRPSAREFALFARAAGKRYSGSYGGLPRVTTWSAWNEPNLSSWLSPQRGKRRVPLSPSIYRKLYLAAHRGLSATGHRRDTILLGELAPFGGGTRNRVPPLQFLREMFCLDRGFHQYRGRAARRRGCKRVRRIPTSGLAYHPYTPRGGPSRKPRNRDDAGIGQLSRITRVLDKLSRRGKLARRRPIWITEYGFQTNPPDRFQYPIRRVPGYMDESEWRAFGNRRVSSYSHYTLIDEKLGPGRGFRRFATFQQGLRFSSGRRKPGVYAAFEMPAFVRLLSSRRVEVFGGSRATPGARATIASRKRGGKYRVLGRARLNPRGYFRKRFRVSGAGRRTYKITVNGRSRVKRPARR